MAENGAPAATAEATPGATPAPPSDPAPNGEAPATDVPADLGEAGKRALAAERSARAAAERELAQMKEAQLSAEERREKRIKDLEAENQAVNERARSATLRADTLAEATRQGFRNPSIAYKLIDQSAVTFDDDGEPKNITALLQAVAKSDPYLVAGQATDFGGGPRGTPPAGEVDMNDIIRRKVRGR